MTGTTITQAIAPALPKLLDETVTYGTGLNTTSAPDIDKGDLKGKEKRKAHSEVERKRRTKINDKISALHDCVPEYIVSKSGTSKTTKNHKANILENTINYINDLESALYKFDPTIRMKIHEAARQNIITEPVDGNTVVGSDVGADKSNDHTASLQV